MVFKNTKILNKKLLKMFEIKTDIFKIIVFIKTLLNKFRIFFIKFDAFYFYCNKYIQCFILIYSNSANNKAI